MNYEERIKKILDEVSEGTLSPEDAFESLKSLPFTDLGFAKVDHHRELRHGFPEVVFCQGKTTEQIITITRAILRENAGNILLTRASREVFDAVSNLDIRFRYNETARVITLERSAVEPFGLVSIVAAGTADLPVAEEARVTASMLGSRVKPFYDVGVAGAHRLFAFASELVKSNAVVVVAGMEGALPSVVGGIVGCPVIAVPTSVGYGASFGGIAALLTMINSCASGVSVVNIDNGFGGGYIAGLINRMVTKAMGETKG